MALVGSLGQVAYDIVANDKTGDGLSTARSNFVVTAGDIVNALGSVASTLAEFDEKNANLNADLGITALNLGMNAEELRGWANELSSATDPITEMSGVIDALARGGITTHDAMITTAEGFDQLADAIGGSSDKVTSDMIPAFKAFNVPLQDVGKYTDILAYTFNATEVTADSFSNVVRRMGPELNAAGVGIDDMSALMLILKDRGYDGRNMMQEFTTAMSSTADANEDGVVSFEEMLAAMKISNSEFDTTKTKLESASEGYAEQAAQIRNENIPAQELYNNTIDNTILGIGGLTGPITSAASLFGSMTSTLSDVLIPVMILFPGKFAAIGPAVANLGSSIAGLGSSGSLALAGLAPLLPILAGLALGIGAVYVLYKIGFLDWVYDQGKACGKWLQDLGASWGQTAKDVGAASADIITHKGFLDWVHDEGKLCGTWLQDLSNSWDTTASDIDKDAKIIEDAQGRLHVVTNEELGGTAKTTKEQTEQVSKSIEEMKDNAGFDLAGFTDYWNRFFGGGELEETGSYKVITLAGEIGEALGKLPGKAVKFGKEFVDSLSDTRKKTDKEIKGTSDSLDELDDPFSGVIDTLVDGTVRIADTVLPGFGSLGVAAVQAGIDIVGADLPGALGGAVAGAAAQVTGPADEIYRRIATVAGGAFLALKEQWGIDLPGAFGNVSEAFGAFGNSVQTAFTTLFTGTKDYILNFAQGFISAGYNIIMYIVQGMQSAAGEVTKAIGDVLGAIWNFLPHSPALEGPLSKLPDFSSYFTQGLEASIPAVQAASMEVMANILPSAQPAAMSGGMSIGTQDNSLSINNVNLTREYTLSNMMDEYTGRLAQKRKQRGYMSVVS